MKTHKILIFFILLQCNLHCFSQIVYSKGYVVKNNGEKKSCLIKNNDWLDNPTKIQYKLEDNGPIITAGIDSIKEFGVDNYSRYLKVKVKIDRSPANINSLNNKKQPEWSEETLFLKELVCGKAGLWEYTGSERSWYFYNIDNSIPEQLIYKQYINQDKILENASFRQQLLVYLQNDHTKDVDLKDIKYDRKSLNDFFKLYNTEYEYCVDADFKKPDREVFNVKVVGSINYSSMSVRNYNIDIEPFDFGSKINWMAGLELEYFLPFNRNIWSIILTPTYEHIYNTKTVDFKLGDILISSKTRTLDVKMIDIPIGIRYTNYLKNDSRLFADISVSSPLNIGFKHYFAYNGTELNQRVGLNVILGAGYSFSNIGFGIKYHMSKEMLNTLSAWKTKYPKISISVSYKLYKIIGK